MNRLLRVLLTLLSHYRRHPAQTLFLAVGLVTGVGLWSAVQIINDHARASYSEADQLLGAQASHWVRARDGAGIDPADYIALRRAGFTQLYPVLETRLATTAATRAAHLYGHRRSADRLAARSFQLSGCGRTQQL